MYKPILVSSYGVCSCHVPEGGRRKCSFLTHTEYESRHTLNILNSVCTVFSRCFSRCFSLTFEAVYDGGAVSLHDLHVDGGDLTERIKCDVPWGGAPRHTR